MQNLDIALGTFTGLALLTGFGPDVSIKIMPIGTANCDFVSTFISAGINQTIHRIYLYTVCKVNIVTPIKIISNEPNSYKIGTYLKYRIIL